MLGRRKTVRMRPTIEYPIGVEFGEGFVKVRLYVLDVGVGGVALELIDPIICYRTGSQILLAITLPGFSRFQTVGSVRYTEGHINNHYNIRLLSLTPREQAAMSRAVSELLERGTSG